MLFYYASKFGAPRMNKWPKISVAARAAREEMKMHRLLYIALFAGCANIVFIPGTKVADTRINRELVDVCEKYRVALEQRDAPALLALAHPNYYEASGTPKGDDDYGYEGLKQVISNRMAALKTVRYNIEYRAVDVQGSHARVDLRYDASFQIATPLGDRWERRQNDKRIELENNGQRWLILAGM